MQLYVTFVKKNFAKDKDYQRVRDHCSYMGKYRGAAHSICNWKNNVANKISLAFYSGSNYNYHFTIKELADEFKGQFKCLGETTENYKTFLAPIKT